MGQPDLVVGGAITFEVGVGRDAAEDDIGNLVGIEIDPLEQSSVVLLLQTQQGVLQDHGALTNVLEHAVHSLAIDLDLNRTITVQCGGYFTARFDSASCFSTFPLLTCTRHRFYSLFPSTRRDCRSRSPL